MGRGTQCNLNTICWRLARRMSNTSEMKSERSSYGTKLHNHTGKVKKKKKNASCCMHRHQRRHLSTLFSGSMPPSHHTCRPVVPSVQSTEQLFFDFIAVNLDNRNGENFSVCSRTAGLERASFSERSRGMLERHAPLPFLSVEAAVCYASAALLLR